VDASALLTEAPPLPTIGTGKVLVVNGDMHGRSFFDHYGNKVEPGGMAWLNKAHADELRKHNRFWRIVENHHS